MHCIDIYDKVKFMNTPVMERPVNAKAEEQTAEDRLQQARLAVADVYTQDMRFKASEGEYGQQVVKNFENLLFEDGVSKLRGEVNDLSVSEIDARVQQYLDAEFDGSIRAQIDQNIDSNFIYRMRRKLGEFLNRGNKIVKLGKGALMTATAGAIGGLVGGVGGASVGVGLAVATRDMADHKFESLAGKLEAAEETDKVMVYEELDGSTPVERLESLFRHNAEARRKKLETDIAEQRAVYQERFMKAGKKGLFAAAISFVAANFFSGGGVQAHAAPLDTPSADVGLGGGVDTVDIGLGPDVVHVDTVDVDLGPTDTANVDIGSSFESGHPTKLGGGLLSDPTETVDIDLGPSEAGVDSVETVEVGLGPDEVSTETVEVGLGPDEVSTETVEVGLGPDDASVESSTETVEVGLGPDEAPTETVEVGLGPDSGDVSTSGAESHVGSSAIEIEIPSDLSLRSGEGGWETLKKLGVTKSEWSDLWKEIGNEIRQSDFKNDVYLGVDGHWRWSYPGPVKPEVADIMRRVISEHRF